MGRTKKKNDETLILCNELKEKGYKFALKLAKAPNEVWATKANKLKSGDFSDKSKWDCFELELFEKFDRPTGTIVEL